jgi:hypothetical protein
MEVTKARKAKRKTANTVLLQVWVTPELYNIVDGAARLANVTMAEMVRRQILELKQVEKVA